MSLISLVFIDPPSESSSLDNSSIEAEIDSFPSELCYFSTEFLSSNCEKVIMSPVFPEIIYRTEYPRLLVESRVLMNTYMTFMLMHWKYFRQIKRQENKLFSVKRVLR